MSQPVSDLQLMESGKITFTIEGTKLVRDEGGLVE